MPRGSWSSAGQGASAGASMGMMAGPWGALIGGLAGGAYGYFSGGEEERPTSDVWGPQKGYLTDIYAQAQDLYGQTKMPSDYENSLYAYGKDFYGPNGQANQMAGNIYGLGQGYSQMGNEAMNRYMNSPEAKITYDYGNIDRGINNDILQAQIDAATSGEYRKLREQELKGTAADAATMGAVGGSRQHQMEAVLTRGALDAATNTAGTMRGQAYDTAYKGELQRAIEQAQLDAATRSGYGAFGSQMAGLGLQAQQGAYGMYNNNIASGIGLGEKQRMAPWQALQAYQQAIGAPMQVNQQQLPNPMMRGLAYAGQGMSAAQDAYQGQQMYDLNRQYYQNYINNVPMGGGQTGGPRPMGNTAYS